MDTCITSLDYLSGDALLFDTTIVQYMGYLVSTRYCARYFFLKQQRYYLVQSTEVQQTFLVNYFGFKLRLLYSK